MGVTKHSSRVLLSATAIVSSLLVGSLQVVSTSAAQDPTRWGSKNCPVLVADRADDYRPACVPPTAGNGRKHLGWGVKKPTGGAWGRNRSRYFEVSAVGLISYYDEEDGHQGGFQLRDEFTITCSQDEPFWIVLSSADEKQNLAACNIFLTRLGNALRFGALLRNFVGRLQAM